MIKILEAEFTIAQLAELAVSVRNQGTEKNPVADGLIRDIMALCKGKQVSDIVVAMAIVASVLDFVPSKSGEKASTYIKEGAEKFEKLLMAAFAMSAMESENEKEKEKVVH